MPYTGYSALRVDVDAGVAFVTIDHPPINLFDFALITRWIASAASSRPIRPCASSCFERRPRVLHRPRRRVADPSSSRQCAAARTELGSSMRWWTASARCRRPASPRSRAARAAAEASSCSRSTCALPRSAGPCSRSPKSRSASCRAVAARSGCRAWSVAAARSRSFSAARISRPTSPSATDTSIAHCRRRDRTLRRAARASHRDVPRPGDPAGQRVDRRGRAFADRGVARGGSLFHSHAQRSGSTAADAHIPRIGGTDSRDRAGYRGALRMLG